MEPYNPKGNLGKGQASSSNPVDFFINYLEDKKYPKPERRGDGDDLYIPRQYIISKPKPGLLPESDDELWEQLKKGEPVDIAIYQPASILWQILFWFFNLFHREKRSTKFKRATDKGEFIRIRSIGLCHCCPLQVIEVDAGVSNGNMALLLGNALISPTDDHLPTSTSLEVYDQNQYTFGLIPDPDEIAANGLGTVHTNYGSHTTNPDAIKVAVIDTGFRLSNIETKPDVHIWHGGGNSSCQIIDDKVGWNFVGQSQIANVSTNGNDNPDDDNIGQHGTLISAIITKKSALPVPPEIMVLKAFDSNGVGSMFTVICALCYAETHDADVINASFVVPSNNNLPHLAECLRRLEAKKVVVVCAAGNRKIVDDPRGFDLDSTPLYPACYSNDFRNIITVTSVWHKDNDFGSENYSSNGINVNVGVWTNYPTNSPAEKKAHDEGYFVAPYALLNWHGRVVDGIVGSSFATPIVTALVSHKIGRHDGINSLTAGAGTAPDIRAILLAAIPHINGPAGLVKNNYYVNA